MFRQRVDPKAKPLLQRGVWTLGEFLLRRPLELQADNRPSKAMQRATDATLGEERGEENHVEMKARWQDVEVR